MNAHQIEQGARRAFFRFPLAPRARYNRAMAMDRVINRSLALDEAPDPDSDNPIEQALALLMHVASSNESEAF